MKHKPILIGLFALVATLSLVTSLAAEPSEWVSVEAENVALSGDAAVVNNDSEASGGSYVRFGAQAATSGVSAPFSYNDPLTSTLVHRLTVDGADENCINYMGNMSGESTAWSADSSRVTYVKYCSANTAKSGMYVYELSTGIEARLAAVDNQWTYAIFDHQADNIYFVDGASQGAGPNGGKPYAVYRVSNPADLSTATVQTATKVVDLDNLSGGVVRDAVALNKNAGQTTADRLFAVQTKNASSGHWRTVVFGEDGVLLPGWDYSSANAANDETSDGDASIWSPNDPNVLYANRATGPTDPSYQRGWWTIDTQTRLYEPPKCASQSSSDTVAHSDWGYHPGTQTDIILRSFSCPVARDADGNESTSWRWHGFLHVHIDPSSTADQLADVRFVADQYREGFDAPYLYVMSLGDVGIGASGYSNWGAAADERKLVGHRNRLDDGATANLKAYEPHPQFSPDGRYVLWQSNSLAQDEVGTLYPAATTGAEGGDDGNVSFLDIYVAEVPN